MDTTSTDISRFSTKEADGNKGEKPQSCIILKEQEEKIGCGMQAAQEHHGNTKPNYFLLSCFALLKRNNAKGKKAVQEDTVIAIH